MDARLRIDANSTLIASKGGVEAIVQALCTHVNSATVASEACLALRILANHGMCAFVLWSRGYARVLCVVVLVAARVHSACSNPFRFHAG
jgi:hypothetical protein